MEQTVYQRIKEALERSEDWTDDYYCLVHTPTNLQLWMVNGFWFFKVYRPVKMSLGVYWKCRLYLKACRVRRQIERAETENKKRQLDEVLRAAVASRMDAECYQPGDWMN